MFKQFNYLMLIAFLSLFLYSCEGDEFQGVETSVQFDFFSEADVQGMTTWIKQQRDLDEGVYDESTFPVLSYQVPESIVNPTLVNNYFNRLQFLNEDILGEQNKNYEKIKEDVLADKALETSDRNLILSYIELSEEVLTSEEVVAYSTSMNEENISREACDCEGIWANYVDHILYCNVYGNAFNHCTKRDQLYLEYLACRRKQNHCPPGFTFDGANCYSGLHFPQGYNGFIWDNGFYTQPNCAISTNNNCCPPGYYFDGANCHYSGIYYPSSSYDAFIWNNTFYVVPNCY